MADRWGEPQFYCASNKAEGKISCLKQKQKQNKKNPEKLQKIYIYNNVNVVYTIYL